MPTSPPQSDPNQTADALIEQAAEWLVKISSEDCSEEDHLAFRKWQQQSPAHQKALTHMQAMIDQLQQLQEQQPQSQIVESAISEQHQLHSRLHIQPALFMFTVAGLLAAFLSWQMLPIKHWLADQSNDYDQWSEQQLIDHSQIKISGHSAYNIKFNAQQRNIELINGNILVDVAKDAQRPFVVETTFANIKALGTRFIVQHSNHQTILTMLESRVEVRSKHNQQLQIVEAGEQVLITEQGIQPIQQISIEMMQQAWQKHSIVVDQMPLDQVLDILQSYQKAKIYYDRERIKHFRVTAILPLNHQNEAFTLLQDSLPIQISHPIPYLVYVKTKE